MVDNGSTDGSVRFVHDKFPSVHVVETGSNFGYARAVGKMKDPITWNGHHIGWFEKDEGQYETVEERVFLDDIFTPVGRRVYDEVGGV